MKGKGALYRVWTSVAIVSSSRRYLSRNAAFSYNYFAYGSNMAPSTMTALRGLSPLAYTAAVLPNHAIAFDVPGIPFIEPSWASVEPNDDDEAVVHGVLYRLSERDFASVCRTEGVPIVYSLHRCRVVPYVGNRSTAGRDALLVAKSRTENTTHGTTISTDYRSSSIPAFTLIRARKWRSSSSAATKRHVIIPPSRSYLNVLLRGAKELKLDAKYITKLEQTPVGPTFLMGNGIAELMLWAAEISKNGI